MSGGFQAPFLSISIAKPSGKYSIVKFIQPQYVGSGAGKLCAGFSFFPAHFTYPGGKLPAAQPRESSFLAHKMGKMLFAVNGVRHL